MKILTAQQIYEADKLTIAKQGIDSDALMERAALAVFNWMHTRLKEAKLKIHLFCGIGNNGGDGLALARHLLEHDYEISVYVVNYSEKRSKDFLGNLDRLKERKFWPSILDADSVLPQIASNEVVVDAIFGIGLNREPDGWVGELIKHLNSTEAFTLSIDMPSGLFTHKVCENPQAVVKAQYTLSFQVPKLVFFLPQTANFVGQWKLLDIGLDADYIHSANAAYEFMGKFELLPLYKPRDKFSHKGSFGHSLLIGGSYGKIGAMLLASSACLNSGAGLVTAYLPQCGYIPMQTANPEVMVLTDGEERSISAIEVPFTPTVVAMGMGMGTGEQTIRAFETFLQENERPLVLDADALNILSHRPDLLELLPKETILTPHPGELKRLIGEWNDDFDKLEKVKQFSQKYQLIVVVKGAHTMVMAGDKGYVNSTGNPGMATAGSGDVLAGMITGLRSQGYTALDAAIFAVYLHGLAGDLVATKEGYEAVTAKKIIHAIGAAFVELFKRPATGQKEERD